MKKHPTDTVSLVFGLIFATFVGWWAVDRATDLELSGGWFLVAVLVLIALITLISTLTKKKDPAPAEAPLIMVGTVGATVGTGGTVPDDDTEPVGLSRYDVPDDEASTAVLDADDRAEETTKDTEDLTSVIQRPDDPTPGARP